MVCLTETWLSEKHFDVEILPEDYNIFRVHRKCKTGGGVLIAQPNCRTRNCVRWVLSVATDLLTLLQNGFSRLTNS